LQTLAREELGIDPNEMGGNPWSAAGISFGLFAIGAALPLIPFLFSKDPMAIAFSVGVSMLGLLALGVVTSLFRKFGRIASRRPSIGAGQHFFAEQFSSAKTMRSGTAKSLLKSAVMSA
jgi:VIT1/CCC1 family predicted Fe2+/Mn2+ transporter